MLVILCLCIACAPGCLILPPSTSPGDDGRIYLFLDLDPSHVNAWIHLADIIGSDGIGLGTVSYTMRIRYRIGDEEPAEILVTWWDDSAVVLRKAGVKFTQLNRPLSEFDLAGKTVAGGTPVSVSIDEGTRWASIRFSVDGNVRLRLRMLDPSLPGLDSDWTLERIL